MIPKIAIPVPANVRTNKPEISEKRLVRLVVSGVKYYRRRNNFNKDVDNDG